jgi:hypothetical protein
VALFLVLIVLYPRLKSSPSPPASPPLPLPLPLPPAMLLPTPATLVTDGTAAVIDDNTDTAVVTADTDADTDADAAAAAASAPQSLAHMRALYARGMRTADRGCYRRMRPRAHGQFTRAAATLFSDDGGDDGGGGGGSAIVLDVFTCATPSAGGGGGGGGDVPHWVVLAAPSKEAWQDWRQVLLVRNAETRQYQRQQRVTTPAESAAVVHEMEIAERTLRVEALSQ